ncbi:MAG: hypothetical protein ACRCXZ_01975 [Patescibacteria group bacterium]
MRNFSIQEEMDLLFKLMDLIGGVHSKLVELEDEGVFNSYDTLQSFMMFICIYAINNNQLNDAKYLIDQIDILNYFTNSENFLTSNKRRDDERVFATLSTGLYYANYILKNTTFSLSNKTLYEFDKFIDLNTYLYNTENEDGNKTEYEDLSSAEKKYTDNIMDNIKELYMFKKGLFEKTDGFKNNDDVNNYQLTKIFQYCEESLYTLYDCLENCEEIAIENLLENAKTVIELYFQSDVYKNEEIEDAQFKQTLVKFLTEDLTSSFYKKLIK